MDPGDDFIASNRLYGGSVTQFGKTFRKFGWQVTFVDVDEPENVRRALTPKCKAIFVESLANPGGVVSDLEALGLDDNQLSGAIPSQLGDLDGFL